LSYVENQDEVAAIAYITDITKRVKAEEMALKLAAIVESSDDGIMGKTLEGVITSWNRGAEKIYGYSADEVIGQSISFLFPPDQLAEATEIVERLKNGQRIYHYDTMRYRNSSPCPRM
jgi:PAS domain S-box-containing protein